MAGFDRPSTSLPTILIGRGLRDQKLASVSLMATFPGSTLLVWWLRVDDDGMRIMTGKLIEPPREYFMLVAEQELVAFERKEREQLARHRNVRQITVSLAEAHLLVRPLRAPGQLSIRPIGAQHERDCQPPDNWLGYLWSRRCPRQ
jgi:hypothetical protein